jgi:ketosteroid isomerase-like protein
MTGAFAGPEEMTSLATRFFDALQEGDVDAVKALYAPGATIWTNTSGRTRPAADALSALAALARRLTDRRYAERRLLVTDSGFVQRHRLMAVRADGAKVAVDACVICIVEDGRIARVEEFSDSQQLAALFG